MDSATAFNHRTHLAWGDVAVDNQANPTMVRIHLKQSKTDQAGNGAHIVLGKTGLELCPVAALLGYIAKRGAQPGPFFRDSRGRVLTKPTFVAELVVLYTFNKGTRGSGLDRHLAAPLAL